PIRGGTVELSAPEWHGAATSARVGTHQFAFGFPRWISERPAPLPLDVPLRLDGMISDLIFESGFRDFDGRGRTIAACQAVLALPLPLQVSPYRLQMRFEAAAPARVAIAIDSQGATGNPIEIGPGRTDEVIDIPSTAPSLRAMTRVRLR